ncbi:ParA family protein [Phycisphaerales bacterium AB-hyl4]|uniref:ParA family protein n=1 Tax=Natronomicrosphaera hydrolytica TaxID=3242702 RepID=A0ABV4U944_9BACT
METQADPSVETSSEQAGEPGQAVSRPGADGSPPRVIAMMNQKGGVGKTTTTVNVGAALSEAGHRVLLIDLDPQAHLSLHVGINPDELERSVYDLLVDDDTTAAEVVMQVTPTLGVLPAEVNLAGVEAELAERTAAGESQGVLRDKTMDLVTQFDYVLLDCPPSLGLLTINGLTLAREVIVPMQAHFLALQGLSKLLETITMVRERINPQLKLAGIVLCMHEANTLLAGEVAGDLNAFLEEARGTDQPWADAAVFQPAVRRNIKLAESPSFGQSIFSYAPESNGAKDYVALAKAIAAHRVHG